MSKILSSIVKLRGILSPSELRKLFVLFVMMLIGSILEVLGISVIPLFFTLIFNPENAQNLPLFGGLFTSFEIVDSTKLIAVATVIFLGLFLFKNIYLTFIFYYQANLLKDHRTDLCTRLYRAYMNAPFEWVSQFNTMTLLRNVDKDTHNVVNSFIAPLLQIFLASIVTLFIFVAVALNTSFIAILFILFIALAVVVLVKTIQSRLARYGKIIRDESEVFLTNIQEGFNAVVDAKILKKERFFVDRVNRSVSAMTGAQAKTAIIESSTPYYIETVAVVGLLGLTFTFVNSGKPLIEFIPVLALLTAAIVRLRQSMNKMASNYNKMIIGSVSIDPLLKHLDDLKIIEKQQEKLSGGIEIERLKSVRLSNVSYTYPGSSTQALRDVSINIDHGKSVAIIGETGSGKSTLSNLIIGMLSPNSGEIYYNDLKIEKNQIHKSNLSIGYIPQFIYLLDDSIKANVALGIPPEEIDETRVMEVIHQVRLHEVVDKLPDGIDTVIGERGTKFSGGQRQRIGIARALYNDPDFLVMDEATSSLDNETEAALMQTILEIKSHRTFVIIAHRLSTIKSCDHIYVMKEGNLIAQGRYEELQNRGFIQSQ